MKYFFQLLMSLAVLSSLSQPAIADSDSNKNPLVEMNTSLGKVTLMLDAAKAPISVANFLSYVDEGFYDGTLFHRVIPGFMVQCGGFDDQMKKKETHPPIKNEATNRLLNLRGSIAMARTSVVDSASSQFFVNTVDNAFLDHNPPSNFGYAVFGKVVQGMSVVQQIENVPTTRRTRMADVPVEPVVIISMRRVE
jgi:peptidyl-prolyl cis-trans isomerase A (cyclophilin A)